MKNVFMLLLFILISFDFCNVKKLHVHLHLGENGVSSPKVGGARLGRANTVTSQKQQQQNRALSGGLVHTPVDDGDNRGVNLFHPQQVAPLKRWLAAAETKKKKISPRKPPSGGTDYTDGKEATAGNGKDEGEEKIEKKSEPPNNIDDSPPPGSDGKGANMETSRPRPNGCLPGFKSDGGCDCKIMNLRGVVCEHDPLITYSGNSGTISEPRIWCIPPPGISLESPWLQASPSDFETSEGTKPNDSGGSDYKEDLSQNLCYPGWSSDGERPKCYTWKLKGVTCYHEVNDLPRPQVWCKPPRIPFPPNVPTSNTGKYPWLNPGGGYEGDTSIKPSENGGKNPAVITTPEEKTATHAVNLPKKVDGKQSANQAGKKEQGKPPVKGGGKDYSDDIRNFQYLNNDGYNIPVGNYQDTIENGADYMNNAPPTNYQYINGYGADYRDNVPNDYQYMIEHGDNYRDYNPPEQYLGDGGSDYKPYVPLATGLDYGENNNIDYNKYYER